MDDRRRTPSDRKSSYCLWQGLLKRILKCEYLLVMYRINMLHYISISLISKGDNGKSYLSFNSLGKSYLSFNRGEDFFRNQPIRNKNCLWWPYLLTDRDKMNIFIEDLPQMLPTKFRFIWPSGFRGEDFLKSTTQKQELPVAAMLVNGSKRNEQSIQWTAHRCILSSFG